MNIGGPWFLQRVLYGASIVLCSCCYSHSGEPDVTGPVDFESQIQPIFAEHCVACHGGVRQNSGLSLLARAYLLAETDSGEPAVVAGEADASLLIHRITAAEDSDRMPPEGQLTEQDIALLRRWIDEGALWPTHWAWRRVTNPRPPAQNGDHPIDAFVQARLGSARLVPSPPASRHELIRRLSLDLLGLLPTPNQVDAFVSDPSRGTYVRLVDRLLDSPRFGERWAQHWLDEARYADSEGYEKDSPKLDAYHFRDWVMQAINGDVPFDQFTVQQIAGDLLPLNTPESLAATKFHLQAQFNLEGGVDPEEDRVKRVVDRVNTVASTWLGLTLGCCQCHSHPYDAFSQRDYYSMFAFFNNADLDAETFIADGDKARTDRGERAKRVDGIVAALKKQRTNTSLNDSIQHQWMQLRDFDNGHKFVRFLRERQEERRTTYVLRRGDFLRPLTGNGPINPTAPEIFFKMRSIGNESTRLDLAMWMVHPDNPLTARVAVNKVWLHLFGRPIVGQPGDFGTRGDHPTHPALLDWLAHFFVHDAKWSRKALIREIVLTNTYRQSSQLREHDFEVDPKNTLLARQSRFRVEAEIVRDIALQTAGLLSDKVGGPSVFPPLPSAIAEQTYASHFRYRASQGDDRYRRGLYTTIRRTAIDPNLSTFDCPAASVATPQRNRSNTALQALAVLQNEVFHEAAQGFAHRLLTSQADFQHTNRQILIAAFRVALGRTPDSNETVRLLRLWINARNYYDDRIDEARALVGKHSVKDVDVRDNAAWIATLRVILNLDEFLTRP
jgi:hypothetical protein